MNSSPADTPNKRLSSLNHRDFQRLGLLALLIGCIFFLFQFYGVSDVGYFYKSSTKSLFRWLYRRWLIDYTESLYSYSHLIPIASLALIWHKRRILARLPRKASLIGLIMVVVSFAIHWIGIKSEQSRLSVISMISLTWSLPFFIRGWPTAKQLLFPCGILIFSIPLKFFDALSRPVRLLAASATSNLLTGLGVDVSRAGTIISSNSKAGFSINIASEHSGVFFVMACISLSLICAYLVRTSLMRRIIIVASSLVFVLLANIARGILLLVAGITNTRMGDLIVNHASTPTVSVIGFGGILITALAMRLQRHDRQTDINVPVTPPSGKAPMWPLLSALAIAGLATWFIPSNARVEYLPEAGVQYDLPKSIGPYEGGLLLYCHNPDHGERYKDAALKLGDECPDCGELLLELTLTEKKLLPPDTLVRKYTYEIDDTSRVLCSIVLSGEHRSSIHRPEVCLVDHNNIIENSFIHRIDLGSGEILEVTVLEMSHKTQKPDGTISQFHSYYAYWFAGIGKETPSHIKRMIWMAYDRLFFSKSYRWAYISVAGHRLERGNRYLNELDSFLKEAHPILLKNSE